MEKTDIAKNNLYFKKLIKVISSEINNNSKPLSVVSRHSDAFIYILSGSCTYKFDDGSEFTVNKGDIFYLAYRSDYTMYIHTKDYRFIFCDFEFNDDSLKKSDMYTPSSSSYAENLFIKLLQQKNSFAEAMATLYSIYGIIITTSNKVYINSFSKNKINEAKKYIDENFKDDALSVSFLAKRAGMSEVYFRNLFKSQYHFSPSQYIIAVRLKNAKELMKYPFLSLEECALQSGFSSLQYFCRVFKKNAGITPAKYRTK